MPLELIVDTLDSVPEALRGEYAEHEGKFRLNVNGWEDTSGLKTALQKERAAAAAAKKAASEAAAKVSSWEGLGKSSDEIKELLEAAEAAKQKSQEKNPDKDAHLNELKSQHEKALGVANKKWADEKAALENEINLSRSLERNAIIETKVTNALTKQKATAEGLDLLTERLGKRIKVETVDGERQITIMSADGQYPMAGSGEGALATFDDLIKEAVEKWPSLFEGSGAGGGGKSSREAGGAGNRSNTMRRADFDKLSYADQATRSRMKGFTLLD